MNEYKIISPKIEGLLTHDDPYFEGAVRPLMAYAVRDGRPISAEHIVTLERYLTDIHHLFLKKLTAFFEGDGLNEEEEVKLQALLQEMIKVKGLIKGR